MLQHYSTRGCRKQRSARPKHHNIEDEK